MIKDLSFNFYTRTCDGSAEPKRVVYWHNLRINDVVCKIYIYTYVCVCVCVCVYIHSGVSVFIITVYTDDFLGLFALRPFQF
jgi:hypothetical protein